MHSPLHPDQSILVWPPSKQLAVRKFSLMERWYWAFATSAHPKLVCFRTALFCRGPWLQIWRGCPLGSTVACVGLITSMRSMRFSVNKDRSWISPAFSYFINVIPGYSIPYPQIMSAPSKAHSPKHPVSSRNSMVEKDCDPGSFTAHVVLLPRIYTLIL